MSVELLRAVETSGERDYIARARELTPADR